MNPVDNPSCIFVLGRPGGIAYQVADAVKKLAGRGKFCPFVLTSEHSSKPNVTYKCLNNIPSTTPTGIYHRFSWIDCILTSVQRQDSPGALDRCMAHLDANVAWYHLRFSHFARCCQGK